MVEASGAVQRSVVKLVERLLEHAGRVLAVSSWPAPSPPERSPDVPVVEARPGTPADDAPWSVFRFATVVADDATVHLPFEIRHADLAELEIEANLGDAIGVELPLTTVAAVAVAFIELQLARTDDDVFQPLPPALWTMVRESGRLDALMAELARLRDRTGPEPSSASLSRLAGMCALDPTRVKKTLRVPARGADQAPEFVVIAVDDNLARVIVVPAGPGRAGLMALARALPTPAPAPTPPTLWHVVPSPMLWNEEGPGGTGPVDDGSRFEVKSAVADDAGACIRLLARVGLYRKGTLVDEREVSCELPVSPVALRTVIDDASWQRLQTCAARFRRRAMAAALDRGVGPEIVFEGSAWARVITRAAAGTALEPRGNTPVDVGEMDAESLLRVDVAGFSLVLSPADDAVMVMVGDRAAQAYASGKTLDGDDEAARAVCLTLAAAFEGSDADTELVIVDEGVEREMTVSRWLRQLADAPHAGFLDADAEAAAVFADVADTLLDER